ncbi:MAG: hypothetical protein MI674_00905 [Cytophagales bacterium]|nr:hypothetical protein [Cytophagales bacterium]
MLKLRFLTKSCIKRLTDNNMIDFSKKFFNLEACYKFNRIKQKKVSFHELIPRMVKAEPITIPEFMGWLKCVF